MDNETKKELQAFIDAVTRNLMRKDALINALLERLALREAESQGKAATAVRAEIRARAKVFLQAAYEKMENKDPQGAAEIDDRSLEELP